MLNRLLSPVIPVVTERRGEVEQNRALRFGFLLTLCQDLVTDTLELLLQVAQEVVDRLSEFRGGFVGLGGRGCVGVGPADGRGGVARCERRTGSGL